MVNLPMASIDYYAPFGGGKGSSLEPRERGRYAAELSVGEVADTLP